MVAVVADRVIVELEARVARYQRDVGTAVQRFDRGMGKIEGSSRRMERNVNASFQRVGAAVKRQVGVIIGALGVREVGLYADAWTEAGNKIAAASQVSGIQAESLATLTRRAVEGRTAFEPYIDLYARLLRSAGQVDASQSEVAAATDIVAKSFKAGGAAAQEQAAGILQLGQALGSGFLQGDELRSLRENAPLLAASIAESFDTTIGGLKALGETGQLSSDKVFRAILSGQSKIEAAFAKTQSTIGDGFSNLRTAVVRYVGDADDVIGATDGVVSALTFLADNLDGVVLALGALGAVALGPKLGSLAGLITSLGAAAAAEIKFNSAILRGTAIELGSAQATASRTRTLAASATASLAAARAAEVEAAARVATAQANLAQNAILLKTVQGQREQAKGAFELQQGLRVAGQQTQALSKSQKTFNEQTRAQIKFQRLQKTLTQELVASEAAHATAIKATTAAQTTASAATVRATAALGALTVASRLATIGARAVSTAFAFIGGVPGAVLLGVLALSSGLIDLSFNAVSAEEGITRLNDAIAKANSSVSDLGGVQKSIKTDTERLERANKELNKAVEAGGDIAIAAANSDIAAINRRIQGNEKLRDAIIATLIAQQAAVKAAAIVARAAFNAEFGDTLQTKAQTGPAKSGIFGEVDFRTVSETEAIEKQTKAVNDLRDAARAANDAGDTTPAQANFLELEAKVLAAEGAAAELGATLDEVLSGKTVSAGSARVVSVVEDQADAFEKLQKQIAKIKTEARDVRLGDLTAQLVTAELALRAQGFAAIDTIEPINQLRQALLELATAEEAIKQEDAFADLAEDLRLMADEALAIRGGTEALEDFRNEGERSKFLDSYRDRLEEAGIEGAELDRIMTRLAGSFDNLRSAVASVEFQSVLSGVKAQIDDIELQTRTLQSAVASGNEGVFDSFRRGLQITETIAKRQKELAEQGFSESEIIFQTEPLKEALELLDKAKGAFDAAFGGSRSGGDAGSEAESAFERELSSIQQRADAAKTLIEVQGSLNPITDDYAVSLQAAALAADLLNAANEDGLDVDRQRVESLAQNVVLLEQQAEAGRRFGGSIDGIRATTEEIQSQNEALAKINPLARDFGFSIAAAEAEQRLLFEAMAAGIEITDELAAKIRLLAAEYGHAVAEGNKLTDAQQRLKDGNAEFRSTARSALSGFISDIRSGITATEALANAIQKVADKLLDLALDSLTSTQGPLGGGGGGTAGAIIGFASALFGAFAAKGGVFAGGRELPRFGSGGVSDRAAIFAEAGAEAAVPLPDGRRIPVDLRVPEMAQPRPAVNSGDQVINLGGITINGVRNVDEFHESRSQVLSAVRRDLDGVKERQTA